MVVIQNKYESWFLTNCPAAVMWHEFAVRLAELISSAAKKKTTALVLFRPYTYTV